MQFSFSLLLALLQLFSVAMSLPVATEYGNTSPTSLESRGDTESYIVIFQSGTSTPDSVVKKLESEAKALGAKIAYEYQTIVKGFSLSLDSSLLPKLEALNDPSYPFIIEQDTVYHTLD